MRLGDLDALKEKFENIPHFFGLTGDCVKKIIDEVQTIDAVPVVHGRWIPKYETKEMHYSPDDVESYKVPDGFSCSRCGRVEYHKEPYCNCGARMDGDQ